MQSSAVQTAMMYIILLEVKSTFTERKELGFSQENIDYTKVLLVLHTLKMMQK